MEFGSAQEVEAAFYAAFQISDLEAMTLIWDDHQAVCIHPFGERIEGKSAITQSWQMIFAHNVQLRFTLSDPWVFSGDSHAIHLVRENIRVEESDGGKTMVVLATNAYRRADDGWRMILPVSYTHLRAHETDSYLVCRLLLE